MKPIGLSLSKTILITIALLPARAQDADTTQIVRRHLEALGHAALPVTCQTNERAGTISCRIECPDTNTLKVIWDAFKAVPNKVRMSQGATHVTVVVPSEAPRRDVDPPKEKKLFTDPSAYLRFCARRSGLVVGINESDFPKTEQGQQACKEILSELRQLDRALELGMTYNSFSDLLQEKALAVEKIKDLRGGDIPRVFMGHADLCITTLNLSKTHWRDEIEADYKESKAYCASLRQEDWLKSKIHMLYCFAIAEKDAAVMEQIFKQEALIIQQEQVRVKKDQEAGLENSLPLLPAMTQDEIAAQLKAIVATARAESK